MTSVSGAAALRARAARWGTSPSAIMPRVAPPPTSPITTSPVWMPMRTAGRMPYSRSSDSFTRWSAVEHLQAGAHRTLRVVLVRLRIAEVGEQPVDQVLRDVPLPALDDGRRRLLNRAHDAAQVLRIEALREDARADQVARHDRELAPLGGSARRIEAVARRLRIDVLVALRRGDRAVEVPRAVAHQESMLVEQPIDRRHQAQRVTAARVVQRAGDAVAERLRREATSEIGLDLLHRESAEPRLRAPPALEQARPRREERVAVGERLRPVRGDDEELGTRPCVG